MLREETLVREEKKQKQISFRTMRSKRLSSKKNGDKSNASRMNTRTILSTTVNKSKAEIEEEKEEEGPVSKKIRDIIERIKEDERMRGE